jgi:hypothetical protein
VKPLPAVASKWRTENLVTGDAQEAIALKVAATGAGPRALVPDGRKPSFYAALRH